jgi:hypothetical protein
MSIRPLSITLFCVFAAACASRGAVFPHAEVQNTPVEQIPWAELPDGRALAAVHGDMQTGEHVSYVRFPPGLRTAIHVHSYSYDGIIIKGAARHFQPASEKQAVWLMPGSFYRVPGNVAHISECSQESECIFAIHQHDAFDRALAE